MTTQITSKNYDRVLPVLFQVCPHPEVDWLIDRENWHKSGLHQAAVLVQLQADKLPKPSKATDEN